MDIYFNPYPGAAKTEKDGISLAVATADAFVRLKNECTKIQLSGCFSEGELPPSQFVLIRDHDCPLNIGDIVYKKKVEKGERDKLLILLQMFSKGRVIKNDGPLPTDDWIVTAVGAPAPILGLAAQNMAIVLTVPTEQEWRTDVLCFEGKTEILNNLWGQKDISVIVSHCLASIENACERFAIRFDAEFCAGALSSAPDCVFWESLGFFRTMAKAQKNNYKANYKLIKSVEGVKKTKSGDLLELRCNNSGYRIFFVYRQSYSPEILIGGFYKKGSGDDSKAQNEAIRQAKTRIDAF